MGASLNSGSAASGRGGSRRTRRSFQPMSEINVTPMVDVMLVLLIIFMVAAPLLTVGVEVDTPETSASALPGSDEPLTISVTADNKLYLMETEVKLDALVPKLSHITENNHDFRILLRADRSIEYGSVMQVLAELNTAGFKRVSLVHQPVRK